MTQTYTALPDPEMQSEFYADVPSKRLIAWGIDLIVVLLLSILVLPFTAFTGLIFFSFLLLCVGFIYRVWTISSRSATWGMRLMAIEFRDRDGQRFEFGTAFLHTLGYTISIGMPLVQLLSIVLMLATARRQGLTDHILGTVAINRRAAD
ncbi:RDD family protein [Poseidonocella sedimentorum]|uniref:Uncharacterized membrane protein YckC, RDD family n=1 Tax=Poseidonocella sedimentorum TaxID=871652 RepID=A0A1I6DF63_9RHOB|nr:RDD family protein [Poseidonocella sedimentorum]SFR03952.1 Uncharacterized membrane protein YckC, RDD family [Poseidonocella sedimentorum]